MRMKSDEADEFRSGIAAGSCDGDSNFSHGNPFIAADIKKGKAEEPSLFMILAPVLNASSIGTAFWRPFGRIFFVLSHANPGSADLPSSMGREVAGSISPVPGRWHVAE